MRRCRRHYQLAAAADAVCAGKLQWLRLPPARVRSPYLWSFSNLYTKGRYVADQDFRADAVSQQVGSALLLKVLEQRRLWP